MNVIGGEHQERERASRESERERARARVREWPVAMGKSKRSRASKGRSDPLSGDKQKKDKHAQVADEDEMMNDLAEAKKAETRGQVQKRHHYELKQWRHEEKELRRVRRKLKKGGPEVTREKKRLLHEIQDKEQALAKRHKEELDAVIALKSAESAADE